MRSNNQWRACVLAIKKLAEIQNDENFETYVLIKSMNVRTTRLGKQYQIFTFQDQTSEISGNLWESNERTVKDFLPGTVVYMLGRKELYQGIPQVNQIKLRLASVEEGNDPESYREQPPMKKEALEAELNQFIFEIKNANMQRTVRFLVNKYHNSFLMYPAAKSNHHTFETGLAFHTLTMLKLAKAVADLYTDINVSLLYSGIVLHDLGKVVELTGTVGTEYTLAGNLLGHIAIIDEDIVKACVELEIDDYEEDILLLRHVVLAHHGLLEFGSPVRPKIIEAEVLHFIDKLDASMQMMSSALKQVSPGEKTPRIFAMDNRNFYKPR